MGRRNRSRAADFAVYLAVRLLVCFLQTLSWRGAANVARALAWLAYHVDKRHRLVAMDNLRHAFPGRWTDAELDRIVRGVYLHFATLITEIVLIPRKLHVNNWAEHIEIVQNREIVGALLSGRPLLIVTGHFGNWELAGYALGMLGFRTYAVARTLDNPYLDAFLRRFREATGQEVLDKQADYERMQQVLEGGGVLATLGDQDAGERGLFVDFFGRPASTHKAIALMALHHQTPVVVSCAVKVGEPLRYQIVAGDVIYPEEYANRPDAIPAMTQRFTTALENIVRQAPEQYLWLHRRWKHQPKQKKAKKAA
jgi:KDO2-lipid IV(A) lauroyltransferase